MTVKRALRKRTIEITLRLNYLEELVTFPCRLFRANVVSGKGWSAPDCELNTRALARTLDVFFPDASSNLIGEQAGGIKPKVVAAKHLANKLISSVRHLGRDRCTFPFARHFVAYAWPAFVCFSLCPLVGTCNWLDNNIAIEMSEIA